MKAQHTLSRLARKSALSICSALLVGTSLMPMAASAYDGTVTFSGTIYETPCNFSDSSVTCYSGASQQSMALNKLWQSGQTHLLSNTISYKVADSGSMTIVTVSYL